jgi:hypothetical protein
MIQPPAWILRNEVLYYIVDAYIGERDLNAPNMKRRIFQWKDGATLFEGNVQAFAAHLKEKFNAKPSARSIAVYIHGVLVWVGQPVRERRNIYKNHSKKRWTDPLPEQWIVDRRVAVS